MSLLGLESIVASGMDFERRIDAVAIGCSSCMEGEGRRTLATAMSAVSPYPWPVLTPAYQFTDDR